MTGMPSLRALAIAMCSFLVSTTQTALGTFAMSRIPPSVRASFSFSRESISASFLEVTCEPPVCSMTSSSFSRCSRLCTVEKFVSMPPSQRWLT